MIHEILTEATKEKSANEFWAMRGLAIQSYANLEQSLCSLLAALGEMRPFVAATIFFKISNTRARNGILEKLLKEKRGDTHNPFWNSLEKLIYQTDQKRNEIVHWHFEISRNPTTVRLIPPNYWTSESGSTFHDINSLSDFMARCDFFGQLIGAFVLFLNGDPSWGPGIGGAWHGIFQQPVIYPPPVGHPLCQTPKGS